jgi:hypothetical protein
MTFDEIIKHSKVRRLQRGCERFPLFWQEFILPLSEKE